MQMWDIVEGKSKEEILEMLMDRDEESERMKVYVDQLMGIVIEKAPELLEAVSKAGHVSCLGWC